MGDQNEQNFETSGSSFRLSSRPIVSSGTVASDETAELPRSYGQSIVVAIARDPESLFVYWDIDWSQSYFNHDQMWHSAGVSDVVSTPPDKIGLLAPGDFALIPFHITFQRLTELFLDTTSGEGSLTRSLARLQEKVSRADGCSAFTPGEHEIFRAMKASVSEGIFAPRIEFDPAEEMRLQKKLESILGFGATSPKRPFGESSRTF